MIVMIKLRGCPMAAVKTRKEHKCLECGAMIRKGDQAFSSMLDGKAGNIQRYHRVCLDCGKKCPDKLEM